MEKKARKGAEKPGRKGDPIDDQNAGTDVVGNVSNGAAALIELEREYVATVTIKGRTTLLLHGWNIESIEEKAAAKKNSSKKKTDDIEAYIYRNDAGQIIMPTKNFCASIRDCGRKFKDPASPRKSMRDLLKAIVQPYDENSPITSATGNTSKYDFVDRQRAVIQKAGITRSRPAFHPGWTMTFRIIVQEPEYLSPDLLYQIIARAGKLEGIGDFRPSHGQYQIVNFSTEEI